MGLFDVVEVNLYTGEQSVLAEQETEENAEAIWKMAIMRRSNDENYFKVIPSEQTPKES